MRQRRFGAIVKTLTPLPLQDAKWMSPRSRDRASGANEIFLPYSLRQYASSYHQFMEARRMLVNGKERGFQKCVLLATLPWLAGNHLRCLALTYWSNDTRLKAETSARCWAVAIVHPVDDTTASDAPMQPNIARRSRNLYKATPTSSPSATGLGDRALGCGSITVLKPKILPACFIG